MSNGADEPLSVDPVELKRLAAQEAFDGKVPTDERNARGQFATPPALAEAMVRLAQHLFPHVVRVRFLDPSVGTGAFISAVLRVYGPAAIDSATGFEVDRRLAALARDLWTPLGVRIVQSDFTREDPPSVNFHKPNLIVCNPPYVRHHHLGSSMKSRLKGKAARLGFSANGLMGLYGYFLLLAHQWLAPDGGGVWIVPAEFLDVNYGGVLKRYLRDQVTTLRIHRFDPLDLQFGDALVTSVVLAFQNTPPSAGHHVRLTAGGDLLQPSLERSFSREVLDPKSKWGPLFRATLPTGSSNDKARLGNFFAIKRGLATGDNRFFVLEASEAKRLGLPQQFLRPILPSPRLIRSDVIEGEAGGFPKGLPHLVLLDCPVPRSVIADRFPSLFRYIRRGERRHVPRLYLPRSRSPWYSQEHRPPPPILCTYMGRKKQDGRIFRFIRNHSQATAFNVYLLLYPKGDLADAARIDPSILDEVFGYLRTVQDLERVGRVYGGGLSKLEPKELASLELPDELVARIREMAQGTGSHLQYQLLPSEARA